MTDPVLDSTPPAAAALARGVTATWWYTALSIGVFYLIVVGVMALATLVPDGRGRDPLTVMLYLGGTGLSGAGAVLLLAAYRRGVIAAADSDPWWHVSRSLLLPLGAGLTGGLLIGLATGSVLFGAGVAAFALGLVHWAPGVRVRLIVLLVVVLILIWVVEAVREQEPPQGSLVTLRLLSVMFPSLGALSLWWWDVVVALDRARATQSRLAAVQERLRLAGDLHDLQGHHLQVIALQLELAERMLPRDPQSALEQVRMARTSVDEARRGTRELAGRFRGVPLPDELANAADLLRAAGLRVDLTIAPDASEAPADVLGPVIREGTTNVLKHGGGAWAQLDLRRVDALWLLSIANDPGGRDAPGDGDGDGDGAGLTGIAERVGALGGEMHTRSGADRFEMTVTVPAGASPPETDDEGRGRA